MSVLVYIEMRDAVVKKASLEALTEARKIAGGLGGEVLAVLAGPEADVGVEKVAAYGAAKVFAAGGDAYAEYSPEGHTAAIVEAANQGDAKVILVAATSRGRDLAPRVAAKMTAMYTPDCTGLEVVDGSVVATRPVYAGKVYMKIKATELPTVISTRPNTFDAVEEAGAGEKVEISPSFDAKVKVVDFEASEGDTLDVTEADVVVSGGRGLKEPENFKLLEDLAKQLGGAVGASRAVVDAGWRPHAEQVGQTGKVVAPSLYFAVGISGAVQHLVGMRTAKTIVAINKDADAPIFKVADYGIVGDALEVVPALLEELKK